MKTKAFFLSVLALPLLLGAQKTPLKVTSDITEVKVHLNNAEITNKKLLNLTSGTQTIIFTGISPKLNNQSIRVEAGGSVNILSISSQNDHLALQVDGPEASKVRDSIKFFNKKMAEINSQIDAYTTQKQMLLKNGEVKGEETGLNTAELIKLADFLQTRILEINRSLDGLNNTRTEHQLRINDLNKQINELNGRRQPTAEIHVVLQTKNAVSTTVELHYVVGDAGWSPIYDLKAEDYGMPINLKYRALVYNNTGIDWNNVKISLSTSDPLKSAAKPMLNTWFLKYYQQANYANNLQNQDLNQSVQTMKKELTPEYAYNAPMEQQQLKTYNNNDKGNGFVPGVGVASGGNMGNLGEIEISELSSDFEIAEPFTVPADDRPYSIDIKEMRLKATYKHYAVPKLDKDAFLVAQIVGWEEMDLISGPIVVYNAGKYIGRSFLDTRNLSDTLDLSLGRDQKVLVTRVKKDEMNSKVTLGSTKKASFDYEITVKNNHNTAIDLELLDQFPISENKEITVSVHEASGAEQDASNGKLTWKRKVSGGEKLVFKFGYSVKYPKNQNIQFKSNQKVVTPRYF